MTEPDVLEQIDALIEGWEEENANVRDAFIVLKDHLFDREETLFFFKGRPGVSYSIRAVHKNQEGRDFFIIFDVIDDDPTDRWLSICFYEDMLSDPDEMGEVIPGGLSGQDGYCFDLSDCTKDEVAYMKNRIDEAWKSAETNKC